MIPLTEKIICDVGNKAKNLSTLLRAGFSVPEGFVIPSHTYSECVDGIKSEIWNFVKENPAQEASKKINQLFRKNAPDFEFPNGFSGLYAVRSSGSYISNGERVMEDSSEESMAGQFDSYLYVPSTGVSEAIVDCWSSLFNQRRLLSEVDKTYLDSAMSVVVQRMVPAQYSAVMMTKDPIDEREVAGIEATLGDCEALVSGSVTGDLYIVDRDSHGVLEKELGVKDKKFFQENVLETSSCERENLCLSDEKVLELYDLGRRIESFYGCPQDVEAVFDKKWYVVQTRPITGGIK